MRAPAAERVPLVLLAGAAAVLAIAALYQVQFYLRVPADLVSFAESPYVSDIIKLRLGVPIYTPIPDNNAYPYTPLSQMLTYAIGAALGRGTDIPFLRMVQFGYVLLASLVAGLACRHLAFLVLPQERREPSGPWFAAGTLLLFLVALDPRFNLYVHTLHNDGLALLVSMTGAWLALRHARGPRAWHLVAMALLPAVGFLVKQNQLMWAGLFTVYLWLEGSTPKKRVILFAAGAGVAAAAVMGGAVMVWGQNFVYWIFGALGDKKVSIGRSLLHLQWAGAYAAMGLLALWRFVLVPRSRQVTALWAMWAFCFAITTYTSGLGFSANHMGPAVILAASWFLVFMRDIWPRAASPGPRGLLPPLTAAALVLFVWAGIGVVRPPKSAVPPDLARYIAAIEREFDGMDTTTVLLDNGSWLYLRRGVLMKDRSMPVSLHVGSNQRVINRAALAETIGRIGERRYQRILAHALDTERSPYDFQNRGSGVKAAILEHYRIVRRIPEVAGIEDWWPKNLLSEVVVLEPRADSTPPR